MALDFKTMSTEKKVTFCGAALIAALSLIAFIICLCVPATEDAMQEAFMKAAKNFSLTSLKIPNILSGINWVLALGFISSLALAAIYYFKNLKISLIPESVPMKFVVPGVVVLTALFAWIYLSVGTNLKTLFTGWMVDEGTFWGIVLIIFTLAFIGIFALAALEKKADLKAALPEILLVLAGLFLLLATIGALAVNEDSENIVFVKVSLVFNTIFMLAFGAVTCLNEAKE